jgi:plasmid stabilization system protein ParE
VPRYRIEFSPSAARQAERIQIWWTSKRPKAPGLFRREIAVAIRQLARAPHSAPSYEPGDAPAMRRLLLPRTRHHLYFVINEASRTIRIHAVWHASRGSGP